LSPTAAGAGPLEFASERSGSYSTGGLPGAEDAGADLDAIRLQKVAQGRY
jgi:hypothetical protein